MINLQRNWQLNVRDFLGVFALDWPELRCADQAHNLYGVLFEPTVEMVPCQGRAKVPVLVSICPPRWNVPVAPAKRPVPLVMNAVSSLSKTPGVPVGVNCPMKEPEILSPLAAVNS